MTKILSAKEIASLLNVGVPYDLGQDEWDEIRATFRAYEAVVVAAREWRDARQAWEEAKDDDVDSAAVFQRWQAALVGLVAALSAIPEESVTP